MTIFSFVDHNQEARCDMRTLKKITDIRDDRIFNLWKVSLSVLSAAVTFSFIFVLMH